MNTKTRSTPPLPKSGFDRFFEVTKRGSTTGAEVRGGLVTFVTMAYIVILNPIILSGKPDVEGVSLDFAAVSANEGSSATNTGTFSDAQGNNTVTITATVGGIPFGTVNQNDTDGTWSWEADADDGDAGPFTVTITATDVTRPPPPRRCSRR